MAIRFPQMTRMVAAGALIAAGAAGPAVAASDDSSAKAAELAKQVHQAYQDLDRYQSETQVEVKMEAKSGETRKQTASQKLAFDRNNDRFRLDSPGSSMVVADGTLKMRVAQHKKHHLEKAAGSPITYSKLKKAVPMVFGRATVPEFALMTEDKPMQALPSQGKPTLIKADGKAQALKVPTRRGHLVMHINPETKLIDRTVKQVDMSGGRSRLKNVTITYDHTIKAQNEAIDEKTFALDTKNSEAVDSLRTLIQKMRQSQQGGQGGGGGHALEGKAAPNFTLERMNGDSFNLKKEKADVVILDFWATWCGPCRKALPKLQSVHDWAKSNNKSVAIYAVNVEESKKKARQFWQQNDFNMPVLMDKDGKVGQKYQVRGIPQTVVIANGKVKAVHVGFSPSIDSTLKDEINTALGSK